MSHGYSFIIRYWPRHATMIDRVREMVNLNSWNINSYLKSYSAADLAGSMRLQYPPNVRIVRTPCTGRLEVEFLAEMRI